jgi:hypothetical protein
LRSPIPAGLGTEELAGGLREAFQEIAGKKQPNSGLENPYSSASGRQREPSPGFAGKPRGERLGPARHSDEGLLPGSAASKYLPARLRTQTSPHSPNGEVLASV